MAPRIGAKQAPKRLGPKKTLSFRPSPKLYGKLAEAAKEANISINATIEELLTNILIEDAWELSDTSMFEE